MTGAVTEGGAPKLKQAQLVLQTDAVPLGAPVLARVRRPAEVTALRARFPEGGLSRATRLTVALEFFSGRRLELEWDLEG